MKNNLNKIAVFLIVYILLFSLTACSQSTDMDKINGNGMWNIQELELPDNVETFAKYVMNDKLDTAIDFYNKKIQGNSYEMYETEKLFSYYHSSVTANLLCGNIDQSTADAEIKKLHTISNAASVPLGSVLTERYDDVVKSKEYFKQGQIALSGGTYEQAIECFEKVMVDDVNYDSSLSLIDEAKESIKENALSKSASFAAKNKYEDAIKILNDVLDILEIDADVETKIDEYSNLYAEKAISEADKVFVDAESDYGKALNIIKAAQQIIPEHAALKQKEEYYMLFQPVDLLASFSSFDHDYYYKVSSSAKDNMGNTYSNALVAYSNPIYAVFDIGKKYNKLSFRCSMKEGTNTTQGNVYLRVYGDGRLLYEKKDFGPSVKPFDIEIDVTGVTDLKIDYKGYWYATNTISMILSDFELVRTVK